MCKVNILTTKDTVEFHDFNNPVLSQADGLTRVMDFTPSSSSPSEFRRMKLVYFSNEFPPDDLPSLVRQLHVHSKHTHHHILARFLQNATLAIRDEVRQLPPTLKELIPPFESILVFAEYPDLRKGPLGGSIDGVLLCAVELATFIGYFVLLTLHLRLWSKFR